MTTLTLDITGMTCAHCVAWVTKALAGIPGVRDSHVIMDRATVSIDPAVVSPERVAEAVTASGYPARVASTA